MKRNFSTSVTTESRKSSLSTLFFSLFGNEKQTERRSLQGYPGESTSSENLRLSANLIKESYRTIELQRDSIYAEIDMQRGINSKKVLKLCEESKLRDDITIKVWKHEALVQLKKKSEIPNEIFQKEKTEDAHEMFGIGKAYELFGDQKKAFQCYKLSAEAGCMFGQLNYAYYLDKGITVEKNLVEAVFWYEKAEEQGYFKASYNIGCFYEDGVIYEQDTEKGFEYFLKSAEQGFALAQNRVALYYKLNKVPKQYKGCNLDKKAKYWWKLAAAQGHEVSRNFLKLYF
eukprot:gene1255-11344_t